MKVSKYSLIIALLMSRSDEANAIDRQHNKRRQLTNNEKMQQLIRLEDNLEGGLGDGFAQPESQSMV